MAQPTPYPTIPTPAPAAGTAHGGGNRGAGWGCPMAGQRGGYQQNQGQPVTQDQAKQLVENQLECWNNPNLGLGDFTENDGFYEATIVTKDGSLVQKIQVHKNTGWFRNVYWHIFQVPSPILARLTTDQTRA